MRNSPTMISSSYNYLLSGFLLVFNGLNSRSNRELELEVDGSYGYI